MLKKKETQQKYKGFLLCKNIWLIFIHKTITSNYYNQAQAISFRESQ